MLVFDSLRFGAAHHPGRTALVATGARRSYGELDDRRMRLANALTALARPGERIAILAENIPQYLDAYYGVPSAGMTLVPLNYRLHPREWAQILAASDARAVLVEPKYEEALREVAGELTVVALDEAYEQRLLDARATPPDARPGEDDDAWLLYTSGTTGRPKGVRLTHRNLVVGTLNSALAYSVTAADTMMVSFPLCHVAGYLANVVLMQGATLVIPPRFEPEEWMRIVDAERVTNTATVPAMLQAILRHPRVDDYALTSLTDVGYGASAMPLALVREAIERFGPVIYAGFGMTELAGNVLVHPRSAHERAARGEEHLLAACGVPMPLVDVRVHREDGGECDVGEVGEIVVRGDQVTAGYLDEPELTAEAMRGGWFHTGDLARRDEEGFFYIVDRAKDMIITGGENVYCREVEDVLHDDPSVLEAAIVGVPDERLGERVVAVVVAREGRSVDADALIARCRARLAGYKSPRAVSVVDALPRTATGKVVKRQLRDALSGS